jgi:hypothetical protein
MVHDGSVGLLKADIAGSGKVRVREVEGRVDARMVGSGDVFYGRKGGRECRASARTAC